MARPLRHGVCLVVVWGLGYRVRFGVQGLGYCRPKGPGIEQAFLERSCRDLCGIQVNDPSVQQLDTWGLGNGTRSSLIGGQLWF